MADRMAQRYHRLPSEINRISDEIVAWDYDRAVYRFATWFDGKQRETVRTTPSKSDGKVEVPKYGENELLRFLGIAPQDDAEAAHAFDDHAMDVLGRLFGDVDLDDDDEWDDTFHA